MLKDERLQRRRGLDQSGPGEMKILRILDSWEMVCKARR